MLKAFRERLQDPTGRDLSILLVEQNLGLAMALADRIVILGARGQIVWSATPPELEASEDVKRSHLGV